MSNNYQNPIDDKFRQGLTNWQKDPSKAISRWHKGQVYNRMPTKQQLNQLKLNGIGHGWMPEQPFINPQTRVLAVGSCFAANFILWLADNGFNKFNSEVSPYNSFLRFGSEFENVAVIAQQFRWAFGELDNKSLTWIDKNKELFDITEEGRLLVQQTLLNTDVLVITLGLSEVWYDKESDEPMWRAINSDYYDPTKHVFKVESMAKTLEWLNTIERLRETYLPKLRIVFTVSPIRFSATFRPVSAFTANNASKAILRAALDEFLRSHPEKLNKQLFYFPSYEIAMEYFLNSFESDNRHVCPTVINNIINYFVSYYCTNEMTNKSTNRSDTVNLRRQGIVSEQTETEELMLRIKNLEDKLSELQKVCDERLDVIRILDNAAKERLQIIEKLNSNK